MEAQGLPKGFITVAEAIKLIESDTRDNAKVDTAFLVRNIPYMREGGNFNIRKLKHENNRVVRDGSVFVVLETEYDKVTLEHAILEHYRKVTGRTAQPNDMGVKDVSTIVDSQDPESGRIRKNQNPLSKYGEDLGSGEISQG